MFAFCMDFRILHGEFAILLHRYFVPLNYREKSVFDMDNVVTVMICRLIYLGKETSKSS